MKIRQGDSGQFDMVLWLTLKKSTQICPGSVCLLKRTEGDLNLDKSFRNIIFGCFKLPHNLLD